MIAVNEAGFHDGGAGNTGAMIAVNESEDSH